MKPKNANTASTIGVHLKGDLVQRIDEIAETEKRSRSNVCAMIIEDRLFGNRELSTPAQLKGEKGSNKATKQK